MVSWRTRWSRWLGAAVVTTAMLIALPVTGQNQDLWLEAELEPAQVFVQAQAIYRLRFYQALDVRDLKMTGPSTRLADVRQIGTERVYEAQRSGRRYRVRERSYAIVPFASGALTLSGAQVAGRIPAVGASAEDGRQPLRLDAATQTLMVKPTPAGAAGVPWLPARSLSLSESWSPDFAEPRPGQALRRSIRIEALGPDAAHIPPLQMAVPGLLVDAQAPRLENRPDGERNVGLREQTYSLIAQRAGTLVVPELKLSWWNLNTHTLESATLPARTLQVLPAAEAQPQSALPHPQPVAVAAAAESKPTPKPERPAPLLEMLLGAAALLCLALALVYLKRPPVRAARRLRRACRSGDAARVRDGLLQWAATRWPQSPPTTLPALAHRLANPMTRQALAQLDRCLYGPERGPCDSATLAAIARAIRQFPAR